MYRKYLSIFLALFFVACGTRECVLDGRVNIPDELVLELPEIPPLCIELGLQGEFVEVNGTTLYIEREGEGPPLVLLHGGPGATHNHFHPHFSRAADFAEVIYYDQRGCGLSGYDRGAKGYSVLQAADDLEALREALGYEEWYVAGHSYGGLLAQIYAHRYPESVSGLVLVCSAVSFQVLANLDHSRELDYLTPKERLRIMQIAGDENLTSAQRIFNRQLAGDWKRQSFYRPTIEEMARLAIYGYVHDPVFPSEVLRRAYEFEPDGTVEEHSIPVLVVEGEWDLTWSEEKPEALAGQYPSSCLMIIPESGHSPFGDRPGVFFRILDEFIYSPMAL